MSGRKSVLGRMPVGNANQDKVSIIEEDMLKELVGTYVDRERRLQQSFDTLSASNEELRGQVRVMVNNFISIFKFLTDGLFGGNLKGASPSGAIDPMFVEKWTKYFDDQSDMLNQQLLLRKEEVDAADALIRKTEQLEKDEAANEMRAIHKDLTEENDKFQTIIKSYKNALKKSESVVAEQKNEIYDLKAKLKRVLEDPNFINSQVKDKARDGDFSSALSANNAEVSKLFVTKQESELQLKQLQDQLAGKLRVTSFISMHIYFYYLFINILIM